MPHVGKLYPVSPARDFSKHVPDFHAQMPVGMIVSFSGCTGSSLSILNGRSFPSEKAAYSYLSEVVNYHYDLSGTLGPGNSLDTTWILDRTEDIGFWAWGLSVFAFYHFFTDTPVHGPSTRCNAANWGPPTHMLLPIPPESIGAGSAIRPMTWTEADTYLNLPADLRF